MIILFMLLSPDVLYPGLDDSNFSPVGLNDNILSTLNNLHPGKGCSPLYAVWEDPSLSQALKTGLSDLLYLRQTGSISLNPLPPGSSPS